MKSLALITVMLTLFLFAICGWADYVGWEENFGSGGTEQTWVIMDGYDDAMESVAESEAPSASGPPGCNGWIGRLGDSNNSASGICQVCAGETTWTDIAVEAWVYCYDTAISAAPPQTGLFIRADPTVNDRYARFYANLANQGGAQLKFQTNVDWTWTEDLWDVSTAGYTAGWYKMKLKVEGDQVWCYFDDMETPLAGCPLTRSELADTLTQGSIGAGILHYTTGTPKAYGYFDQIEVLYPGSPPTTPTPTPVTGAGPQWMMYW